MVHGSYFPVHQESQPATQPKETIMALVSLSPGNTPVFTATPQPVGATLPTGVIPTWTSSDTTNAPVTADPTGLIGTVAIPATAVVGTSVTLTVTATLPDGTTPIGTLTFTIVAAPPPVVTSFSIAQTA